MLSLQSLAILLLSVGSHAIPRHNDRNTPDEDARDLGLGPRPLEPISDTVGVLSTSSTDYKTMPPGTYTESISTGLVRIIVVNDPTRTTTAANGNCPAECDCSGIKDKESPEYVVKPRSRFDLLGTHHGASLADS
ncbi:hypothetical protein FLONG3_6786 [Fusarium longipes]|uniref:Uncharacterized protein n=1 Tax=Fusarium longipes TaxID=694270 RepID=A0A395SIY4_9HYPO|nr:hypothetical protein FLONG3_6786 [Fusarium longipes]